MRKRRNKPLEKRYSQDVIISREAHRLSKNDMSDNALKVINRLNQADFEAYLVGGGVRDLLLGKKPKDFDVATCARPNEVKALFKNARIIGKRFQLAHILFRRDIIEVATFRGSEDKHKHHKKNEKGMVIRDNVYGQLTDDVWRRDLSINALYYDVKTSSILDFAGGVNDINDKVIRIIGEPKERFLEDPVRMLRAVRFAAKLEFTIEEKTLDAIKEQAPLISEVSSSRLFDEITKLYHCGHANMAQKLLYDTELFSFLFPLTQAESEHDDAVKKLIKETLNSTDLRIKNDRPVTPAFLFAAFLWHPLLSHQQHYREKGMTPLGALEKAMKVLMSKQQQQINIPKRFIQSMREIWMLQFQFTKRYGKRPLRLLNHPRFRAAYDFLLIRALSGDEDPSLAEWWTDFQSADEEERQSLIQSLKRKNK